MFHFVANNLGLDFVNTRIIEGGAPVDLLKDFDDLINWLAAAGLMNKTGAMKAKSKWSGTSAASDIFAKAVGLRDSLKQMAVDLAQGRRASKTSLDKLNEILRRNSGFFEIRQTANGCEKQFHSEVGNISNLLVPVAESAADLLCFGDLNLVRKCENPECVIFFYDTTKNHKRRWCSMAACGNRAKAAAFYERKRSQRKGSK